MNTSLIQVYVHLLNPWRYNGLVGNSPKTLGINITCGLFGWGWFGFMDLDLRAQIQILCLNDLKPLEFGFGLNSSGCVWILEFGFEFEF